MVIRQRFKATAAPRKFADKTAYETGGIYTNHAHRTLDDGHAGWRRWPLRPMRGGYTIYTATSPNGATTPCAAARVSTPQNCRTAARQPMGDRDQRNYLGVRLVIRKHRPAP